MRSWLREGGCEGIAISCLSWIKWPNSWIFGQPPPAATPHKTQSHWLTLFFVHFCVTFFLVLSTSRCTVGQHERAKTGPVATKREDWGQRYSDAFFFFFFFFSNLCPEQQEPQGEREKQGESTPALMMTRDCKIH